MFCVIYLFIFNGNRRTYYRGVSMTPESYIILKVQVLMIKSHSLFFVVLCLSIYLSIYKSHSINKWNFQKFFHKCNLYIAWIKFISKSIYLTNKQKVPTLNRVLSSNFWRLKSKNHEKSTECVICTKEKMLANGLNIGLLPSARDEKKSMEWKHTDSPVKEKFWVQLSVKNVVLSISGNMKGPISINFLNKSWYYQQRFHITDSFGIIHKNYFHFHFFFLTHFITIKKLSKFLKSF